MTRLVLEDWNVAYLELAKEATRHLFLSVQSAMALCWLLLSDRKKEYLKLI